MVDKICDYGSCVRVTVCSSQGGRKYMEDRVNVHCKRKANGDLDYIYLGVYDGHGGADASHFAQDYLRLAITEQKGFDSDDDETVLRAIKDGFLQTHYEMWKTFENWPKTASGYPSTSGTTASVAIIKKGKVYVGHVGDSGVVIGRRRNDSDYVKRFIYQGLDKSNDIDGVMLTVDHKPDHPDEIRRIENVGGEVMKKSGVMRVVWTRTIRGHQGPVRRSTSIEKVPFLAVARALGDLWSYNSALDQFVVSPEPDVSVIKLEKTDTCLILGSDGLWNVMKAQSAAVICNAEEMRSQSWNDICYADFPQNNHARLLARHALFRWGNLRADNVTVIAVIIDPIETCKEQVVRTLAEHVSLDIEAVLTEYPSAMIRILPDRTQVIKTDPLNLEYVGASDPHDKPENLFSRNIFANWSYQYRNTAETYNGPGYTALGENKIDDYAELTNNLENYLLKPVPYSAISSLHFENSYSERQVNGIHEPPTNVQNNLCKPVLSDDDEENNVTNIDRISKITTRTTLVEPVEAKSCKSRAMLINNKPNMIALQRRERNNLNDSFLIATSSSVLTSTVHKDQRQEPQENYFIDNFEGQDSVEYVLTTPNRRRKTIDYSAIAVENSGKVGCIVKRRRRRTSGTPKIVYNLRRTPVAVNSADKFSSTPSRRVVTRHGTTPVASVKAARRSQHHGQSPYALRDRRRQSVDAAVVDNKKAVNVITVRKKRSSQMTTTATTVSAADDTFAISFAKRLKIFVDSGLNKFRRE